MLVPASVVPRLLSLLHVHGQPDVLLLIGAQLHFTPFRPPDAGRLVAVVAVGGTLYDSCLLSLLFS